MTNKIFTALALWVTANYAQSNIIIDLPASQKTDVTHIAADLNFDWENQVMNAVAELWITTPENDLDTIVLDAQAMEIHKIMKGTAVMNYSYAANKIKIPTSSFKLGNTDTIQLSIHYTAQPELIISEGSAAITDEKGLYFINANQSNPLKTRHLWTQGEVKANSVWMPCVDEPNDKLTHEFFIHTPKDYVALSNGALVEVKELPNEKVFHWSMTQMHSPYLMMMAVGPFAIVSEKWNDIPVDYYVEKEWEKYAIDIFGSTPEMLTFFSEKLNYPYPWNKYAQVVVRDYVSGAMENTTATIHGDFLYRTKQELVDEDNELIIAHELFHHWFGDLVTCESWGNLPLNESFANYSEYLWLEYKYSKADADYHAITEADGYFYEYSEGKKVPLIRKSYNSPNDMFDAHSYNKGGRVLHMLRNWIGDDAFFAALNTYLTDNAYQTANYTDLQKAFEKHTDKDVAQFFKQWFLNEGHPVLSYKYQNKKGTLNLTISQDKSLADGSYYTLPLKVGILKKDGTWSYEEVLLKKQKHSLKLKIDGEVELVLLDAEGNFILSEIKEDRSLNEWMSIYEHSNEFVVQYEALENLKGKEYKSVMDFALNHLASPKHYALNLQLLEILEDYLEYPEVQNQLLALRFNENPDVRSYAIDLLMDASDLAMFYTPMQEVLDRDSSIMTLSSAVLLINAYDPAKALPYLKSLEAIEGNEIIPAILTVKASNQTADVMKYAQFAFQNITGYGIMDVNDAMFEFMNNNEQWAYLSDYSNLLAKGIEENQQFYVKLTFYSSLFMTFEKYKELAESNGTSTQMDQVNEMLQILRALVQNEKDPKVRQYLGLDK